MNQRNASMTVIGAGSYGTALAITLARNGHEVVLWGHDPEHIATLERDRCNAAFLPDVPFPIRSILIREKYAQDHTGNQCRLLIVRSKQFRCCPGLISFTA